jgi:hypothetical protein
MSIKSVISHVNIEKTGSEFPKLMASNQTPGLIVMFVHEGRGMVVAPVAGYGVGHYTTNWRPTSFYDYLGTITLENGNA